MLARKAGKVASLSKRQVLAIQLWYILTAAGCTTKSRYKRQLLLSRYVSNRAGSRLIRCTAYGQRQRF